MDSTPCTLSGVKGTPRSENFLDGIQHAGADVAVNHTNGTQVSAASEDWEEDEDEDKLNHLEPEAAIVRLHPE